MKNVLFAVVAMTLSAGAASAATLSFNYDVPTPNGPTLAPTSTSGEVRLNYVGNDLTGPMPHSRSPWDGTAFEGSGMYHSVSRGGSITYDFEDAFGEFSLMWGSPDSHNVLDFYLDGLLTLSLLGTDVDYPPAPGTGFVNVTVSDFAFDKVVFSSTGTAFEFAQVQAVPLPAAAWMMIAALGGLGFASRRRKAA